jgi:hypothetical protein
MKSHRRRGSKSEIYVEFTRSKRHRLRIDLFKVATVPQSQKSCGNLTTSHHGGG